MKAREIMTSDVECVTRQDSLTRAAQIMRDSDIGAVPVVEDRNSMRLVGVITDRDILYRVVAEGRDPRRTPVLQVATRQIFTCGPDDPLESAMNLMASQNVRRLPVVDEAQRVIGWLTLSDLSRHLLVESEVVQNALTQIAKT